MAAKQAIIDDVLSRKKLPGGGAPPMPRAPAAPPAPPPIVSSMPLPDEGAPNMEFEEAKSLTQSAKPKELKAANKVVEAVKKEVDSAPSVQAKQDTYDEQIAALKEKMNGGGRSMSTSDKIALGLLTALPTLIGAATGGIDGAAIGADVSLNAFNKWQDDAGKAEAGRQAGLKDEIGRLEKRAGDEFAQKGKKELQANELADNLLDRNSREKEGAANRASSARASELAANGRDSKRNLDAEFKLRKELQDSEPYKEYAAADQGLKLIRQAKDGQSPFGDLDTMFTFLKALDPKSVVRDSETGMFKATGAMDDKFKSILNAWTSGKPITKAQYKDLVTVVERRTNALRGRYDQHAAPTRAVAERQGIDRMYIDPVAQQEASAPPPPPGPAPASNGGGLSESESARLQFLRQKHGRN